MRGFLTGAAFAAVALFASAPAFAQWYGPGYGDGPDYSYDGGPYRGDAPQGPDYDYDWGEGPTYDGPYMAAPDEGPPVYEERSDATDQSDPTAYCKSRFKSYDETTGTYLGYDGQRHPCP